MNEQLKKEKYIIEVECLIPSVMFLETSAENEDEALKNLEKGQSLRSYFPTKQYEQRAVFKKVKIKNAKNMIKLNKNY